MNNAQKFLSLLLLSFSSLFLFGMDVDGRIIMQGERISEIKYNPTGNTYGCLVKDAKYKIFIDPKAVDNLRKEFDATSQMRDKQNIEQGYKKSFQDIYNGSVLVHGHLALCYGALSGIFLAARNHGYCQQDLGKRLATLCIGMSALSGYHAVSCYQAVHPEYKVSSLVHSLWNRLPSWKKAVVAPQDLVVQVTPANQEKVEISEVVGTSENIVRSASPEAVEKKAEDTPAVVQRSWSEYLSSLSKTHDTSLDNQQGVFAPSRMLRACMDRFRSNMQQ